MALLWGARFSMWTVGIQNGFAHPLGQSVENREAWTTRYVNDGHQHLSAALGYIRIHLHNEFIEKYSLQGIPGLAILLFFFMSMIGYAIRNKSTAINCHASIIALWPDRRHIVEFGGIDILYDPVCSEYTFLSDKTTMINNARLAGIIISGVDKTPPASSPPSCPTAM